jgi:hypothetical protein
MRGLDAPLGALVNTQDIDWCVFCYGDVVSGVVPDYMMKSCAGAVKTLWQMVMIENERLQELHTERGM